MLRDGVDLILGGYKSHDWRRWGLTLFLLWVQIPKYGDAFLCVLHKNTLIGVLCSLTSNIHAPFYCVRPFQHCFFLKIRRPECQQLCAMTVFLNHSREASQNIQGKIVDIPTLKAATVNTDAHVVGFFFFYPAAKPFEICNWCEQKHTNTVVDLGRDRRGWNDTTRRSRKWATPLIRSCWEAGATTLADQFPTSNPVWQEVVFLRTLRHFTPGQCYRSINNEAVNGAHKCPFRAKFWA